MEFEQKAEEKKMSMSKNIARLAVTAGLTAALSFGGVMAPVTMAFAAEGGATGSVTIKNANHNVTDFKGYKIFDANVVKDENGKTLVSNITWANEKVEAAVKGVITGIEPSANIATAQDAAEWIKGHVMGTDEEFRVASESAAYKIAAAVSAVTDLDDSSDYTTTSNGVANNLSHGYWLFVTDASTVTDVEAATAPIFTVVGDEAVKINEKTSIPTVDKEVKENGTWGNVSDSQIGEEIEYRLTGSVADNIDTFATYTYEFHDHLSVGLEAIPSSVAVTINGQPVQPTNNYSVQLTNTLDASNKVTGHDLVISFTDLKAAAKASNVTLTKNSKVVVTYKAKLTSDAEYTATGNTNEVTLVYSNDPMSTGTGTSVPTKVTDHVFRLDVTKVDKDDQSHKLEATFQVKMTYEGNKKLTQEKWLTQDGGLTEEGANAGKFKTDKDSEIYIPGLVAGTYEITECDTPAGYNTLAPFTITVAPEYKDDGSLKNLNVTSSNTEMVTSSPTNDATIPVTIQNKKGSGLPLTGLNGVTFTWIAGGAVLCIGVAHLIRSRKQAEESEQE